MTQDNNELPKIEITHDIPLPPPTGPYKSPDGLMIEAAIRACREPGDSFLLDTEKQKYHAYVMANRMNRRAICRKQPDGKYRIWIVKPH